MRFILNIFIIAGLSFFAGFYAPWWFVAVVAFAVSLLLPQRPAAAFLSGFLGIFFLWIWMAAFINHANTGILASRIAPMFGMGNSSLLLIFITGLIGGVVAGFASLSASFLRQ